jgi:hypothetical protein
MSMCQASVANPKACKQDLLLSIAITIMPSLVKERLQKIIQLLERAADHTPETMLFNNGITQQTPNNACSNKVIF